MTTIKQVDFYVRRDLTQGAIDRIIVYGTDYAEELAALNNKYEMAEGPRTLVKDN